MIKIIFLCTVTQMINGAYHAIEIACIRRAESRNVYSADSHRPIIIDLREPQESRCSKIFGNMLSRLLCCECYRKNDEQELPLVTSYRQVPDPEETEERIRERFEVALQHQRNQNIYGLNE